MEKQLQNKRKSVLQHARRIVIKIGSALLTQNGRINPPKVKKYVNFVNRLTVEGYQTAVVSSGAVASAGYLGSVGSHIKTIRYKQALAGIGQVTLMSMYQKFFSKHNIQIAQLLLSEYSLRNRESYLNAQATVHALFKMKVLPIINENDPLATEALTFGGNDILGAFIAGLISADLFINFTDVDGYYTNFGTPEQQIISEISLIDGSIDKGAHASRNTTGTGGMLAKIEGSKIAGRFGIPTLITNGNAKDLYSSIFLENRGTLIHAQNSALKDKKKWIVSGVHHYGVLTVDNGAKHALLEKNSSLLPAGILSVRGKFHAGDIVSISDTEGFEIAKGRSNFSSYDLEKIYGKKTSEILKISGLHSVREAVHKNDLVITGNI